MWARKITTGFVIQIFDTDTNKWVSQEFIAADQVEYEDMDGNSIEPFDEYLPFEMVQPPPDLDCNCPFCSSQH